jgi:hypothetical protein
MAVLATVWRCSQKSFRAVLAAACAVGLAACGSTAVTSTEPTAVKCTLTLTGPDSAISASGGSGEVVLSTTPECAWTASADASWVAHIEPSSGQGSGTLRVDVAPNPAPSSRQATLLVNSARAAIQQAPAPCQYVLSSSDTDSVDGTGGSYRVTVSAIAGCSWTATSTVSWVRITSGSSGNGSGVVEFIVDANPGTPRVAALTIAGQSLTVAQAATLAPAEPLPPECTFVLAPETLPVPAAGGAGPPLSLITSCAWTATTNVAWITMTSASGQGNANVGFTVAPNAGAARSGMIRVGSAIATIDQAAAPCSFGVSQTTIDAAATASNGSITVSAGPACNWTATSSAPWITITSVPSGLGSGTVAFSVAANAGAARSGTITVGSATTTINQAAAPCSFVVNPTTIDTGAATRTGSITVSTTSFCSWTASSGSSWITITSGDTGSGNGTVEYRIAANTGAARNGTLTVAGRAVTVTQAAAPPDCTTTVNPLGFTVAAAGAVGQVVTVTTGMNCPWAALSNVPWITITAGMSGSGSGSVTFRVAAGTAARNGTLTVAGRTVTVSQSAPCAYTVSPLKVSMMGEAGPGPTINITTASGCAWTATTSTPWLTITSPMTGSGTGTGSVTFRASASGAMARTGSLSIAGQTVTVDQEARCSYMVTVAPRSFPAAEGMAIATVTTAAGCPWMANSDSPWIVEPPGGNRNGPGMVSFRIVANTGTSRTGHVTVAGQTFEIVQAAKP